MRFNSVILASVAAVSLLLAGCGGEKKMSAVDPARDKVFQSASAEVKGQWDQAMGAVKSNDYFTAAMSLKGLYQNPALTPDQKKAVTETTQAFWTKMYEASNKGDKAAEDAIKAVAATMQR
jgi:outer membrane murein-binding lipoprotein Lpp